MTCGGCVASVTRVLKAVPGVVDVAVTLRRRRRPKVDVRSRAHRMPPRCASAIEDAGYDVARKANTLRKGEVSQPAHPLVRADRSAPR